MSQSQIQYFAQVLFEIKPGKREEFIQAITPIISPTQKEAGCLFYEVMEVLDEKHSPTGQFKVLEKWISYDYMMGEHLNQSYMKKFFEDIKLNQDDSIVQSFLPQGEIIKSII